MGKEDKFIIIASDGIWEFLSSLEVLCKNNTTLGGEIRIPIL
jgi:serine/threonine protein phosphatase PrpC